MSRNSAQLDPVFRALADPTRRAVLQNLSRGEASVSELAADVSMALPSFMQDLQTLEDCGLVSSQKSGRVRVYRLKPKPLRDAEHWLGKQRTHWERRLDQLDNYLQKMKSAPHTKKKEGE